MGASGVAQIARGSEQVKQNKDDMAEAWHAMSGAQKTAVIFGTAGTAISGVGGGVLAGMGHPMAAAVQESGAGFQDLANVPFDKAKVQLNRIDLESNAKKEAIQHELDTKMNALQAKYAVEAAGSATKLEGLKSAKEFAEVNKAIAKASSKREVEALGKLAEAAAVRRDQMLAVSERSGMTLQEIEKLVDPLVEQAEANTKRSGAKPVEVVLQVPKDAALHPAAVRELVKRVNELSDTNSEVRLRLEELENDEVPAREYSLARR